MLNLLNTYINSPLDQFEIRVFLGFVSPFYDLSCLSFTTFSLYTLIVLSVILGLNLLTNNNGKIVGSRWLVSQEAIYDTILNMVKGQISGKSWGYYFPLIYTFFIFIFTANLISMIPYSFALTSHLVFIVSLSTIIWLGATITGFYRHGLVFFSLFVPTGTPLPLVPLLVLIELLSYIARAISLGLRLMANILAGHLLMIILAGLTLNLMSINIFTLVFGFVPLAGILAILCLEFAIAMIQSYVWAILTCSYLKDSLYLH
uniref:ATP synthase subunit a n=3 Tax=Torulaspora TaxID=4948 RepID=A0A0H3V276_TORDE|nr:ATP synthase F0 subunit a [Torulaspora delbrueckii]YP_009155495.1 ATP synthase F0 subunit a [Torulaspora pretoriensis]YP_009155503.1 ATP synthase F0 subunit a [Torulaspora franciscae]AJG02986.1 ATP synthase F0 subunit a [Torulaspora pretoriensis]AJG02994.1 ATP synthase F0 subunit a [Torulaspora franciscae]AJG03003.1 ATP synthase F0 subunit a [Torulaspora franciscae]AJG03013.1 ATP synthase F0 subunit a [Torulaspora pretoriensis]AJG03033.1 ATP synthase F0 subunit a [Torulaspora delbrueckii]